MRQDPSANPQTSEQKPRQNKPLSRLYREVGLAAVAAELNVHVDTLEPERDDARRFDHLLSQTREAIDRRDGGPRFAGLDVQGTLASVRDEIAPAIHDLNPLNQESIDAALIALDGTSTKQRLGGNAT